MPGLGFGFSVIQMAVLPVEPSMAELVREYVPAPGHGEPFAEVNRLQFVIPNAVGIGIPAVHFTVRQLTDRDPISEWKHDARWNPHEEPACELWR